MKNSIVLLVAMLGIASFASAYESELDDREGRKLGGWWKKKDSVGTFQRCCLQTDEVLASDDSPCKCPKRAETAAKWWFWTINVKAKFEKSCGKNGSLYRKAKVANFANAPGEKGKSIVDIASASAPEFTTLVDLVVAADLAGALSGPGPFTVFAPTNAAFAAALSKLGITKEDLEQDTDLLTSVLLCHVVEGNVPSTSLSDGDVETLNTGKTVSISVNGDVKINGDATVTTADVLANNGVIHVIDKVLDCEKGTIA